MYTNVARARGRLARGRSGPARAVGRPSGQARSGRLASRLGPGGTGRAGGQARSGRLAGRLGPIGSGRAGPGRRSARSH